MNNKEFIAALSERTGQTAKAMQTLTSNLVGLILDNLQEETVVTLPQFGNFEVRKKLERVIINPTTRQRMLVPPKLVVNFKPAQMLKDKMR